MILSSWTSAAPAAGVDEEPFYIPATVVPSRPRRGLKHGDTFAVVDSHGDIGASGGGQDGIFHADTRYLSRLELLLNGMQPLLLGSNLRDDNSVLTVDLTNPDMYFNGQLTLARDTIHALRTLFVWRDCVYQRIALQNHGDARVKFSISVAFDSDFADLFEVRGLHRDRRGTLQVRSDAPTGRVEILYEGLDDRKRRSVLAFEPPPAQLHKNIATYIFDLRSGERCSICLRLACDGGEQQSQPHGFFRSKIAASRELKSFVRQTATVVTSNEILNETLSRSMADLYMLTTQTPEGRYPYAGIPWYSATFGRDGILTAIQMLCWDPSIAKGVLKRLSAYQATAKDPLRDAQPGKILHEMRLGEMAALGEIPFGLYYGSADSTPLFVLLFGLYVERTGDLATMCELWPNLLAALDWIDTYGDADGDGFVEYYRATERGLTNQGWKDSHDAVFHEDGRLAEGPIALAEVQGYVFAAKQLAARCARRVGDEARAQRLESDAARLYERFNSAFWCDSIGTYTIALDGNKKPCCVRTSNAGQVLFSGIAEPMHATAVAKSLMGPQFFSGWGIRTVARDEARYNPMSYHNGSIWPHDNALIALGFSRYGFSDAADRVFSGLLQAAAYMEFRRLPELFCGFRRRRGGGPTLYPVACSPQAWAAAAPFAMLQALLGLEFDPGANEIRLRQPHLPSFIKDLTIRGLRLGDATVDLALRGQGKDISMRVLRSNGDVRVSAVNC
ncbi:MAG: glycogen debranching N-terminal domain-containing protein [Sphingobacteriales bacterium]